jgi:adenylosuccinate lyase
MSEIVRPKAFSHNNAISSLDGRFRGKVENIAIYFSEFATNRYRIQVEIEYLVEFLSAIGKSLDPLVIKSLRNIYKNFSDSDQAMIWQKDEIINHDTKAIEYFLQAKFDALGYSQLTNFIHFGLTSSDIDYTALALQLRECNKNIITPTLESLITVLGQMSEENRNTLMLARTHGQPAVPTTAGKELANFVSRLIEHKAVLKNTKFSSKVNGAVGNYNALYAAYPDVDWPNFSKKFLKKLGLSHVTFTTQIPPLDSLIAYLSQVKLTNTVIIGLSTDMWRYLALGYMTLRGSKEHVGSSTMPQKINPIGFELAESYCSLANGMVEVMERRLPVNRWQRDLTDKYLVRELGQVIAMSFLSYTSMAESLQLVTFNKAKLEQELLLHWESIAEGIQTILRTSDIPMPYEKIKELTRGKEVTKEQYQQFIDQLAVGKDIKLKLKKLSPLGYVGWAKSFPQP